MPEKTKVLVVDDEPRLLRLVSEVLKAVGYQVATAVKGEAALEAFALEQPSLVLLDITLDSAMDGFEVCRRIREFSDVPVIMLTAKAQEADRLRGFDVGADDYLTKPFSSKELVARAKAVLRRSQRPEEAVTRAFACGDLQIDFARHLVKVRGETVSLTRTEYAVLRELALHANQVLLHQDLLAAVWGPEYRDDVDYLRVYMRRLRQKIGESSEAGCRIVNVPGVGYMLSAPDLPVA
jgi:DNA-binding response OmpR family regulator